MLPVRVKSVSPSPCSLSHASSFLQRFLSSDACSEPLVRGYAASVAHALHGSGDYSGRRRKDRVAPDEGLPSKPSAPSPSSFAPPVPVSGNGERPDARSNSETATKKQKRKRPSLDGKDAGSEDAVGSRSEDQAPQKEVAVPEEHRKKRRKKEDRERHEDEQKEEGKVEEKQKEKVVLDGSISDSKHSINTVAYGIKKEELDKKALDSNGTQDEGMKSTKKWKEKDKRNHEKETERAKDSKNKSKKKDDDREEKEKPKENREEEKSEKKHKGKHKEKHKNQVLNGNVANGLDGKADIKAVSYPKEEDHTKEAKQVLDLHETGDCRMNSGKKSKKKDKKNAISV